MEFDQWLQEERRRRQNVSQDARSGYGAHASPSQVIDTEELRKMVEQQQIMRQATQQPRPQPVWNAQAKQWMYPQAQTHLGGPVSGIPTDPSRPVPGHPFNPQQVQRPMGAPGNYPQNARPVPAQSPLPNVKRGAMWWILVVSAMLTGLAFIGTAIYYYIKFK